MKYPQGIPENKSILIIGDDTHTRERLLRAFVQRDTHAWALPNDSAARLLSYLTQADLIILDIPPSETNEMGLLRQIRGLSTVPVIVLLTSSDYRTRINGLDHGADYVMTKPFGEEEICARVRALFRRAQIPYHTAAEYWTFVPSNSSWPEPAPRARG